MNEIKVMSVNPENAVCIKLILSDHIVIMDLYLKGKLLSLKQDSSACYNSKSSLFVSCTKYKRKILWPSHEWSLSLCLKGQVRFLKWGCMGDFTVSVLPTVYVLYFCTESTPYRRHRLRIDIDSMPYPMLQPFTDEKQ